MEKLNYVMHYEKQSKEYESKRYFSIDVVTASKLLALDFPTHEEKEYLCCGLFIREYHFLLQPYITKAQSDYYNYKSNYDKLKDKTSIDKQKLTSLREEYYKYLNAKIDNFFIEDYTSNKVFNIMKFYRDVFNRSVLSPEEIGVLLYQRLEDLDGGISLVEYCKSHDIEYQSFIKSYHPDEDDVEKLLTFLKSQKK